MNANKEYLLKYYRLSEKEYQSIETLLAHTPSRLELALFSALWSEHCSYKSSIVHLKKLHFDSKRVVSSLGENAGVIDLGEGEKVAFKVESHNHPSRIMPYHGAATGVGGILRDVFIMNARPIALANYLCFGQPSVQHTADLVDGVVRGIGGYGNCIGIPTITGAVHFHSSYNENILVNALAIGYFGPNDRVMTSKASGAGNLLVYAGARTGRDGIHGASMASESFESDTQQVDNKTCVQIGDPFYGKLLMEACLEVMNKNLVVSAQDMGAAGLVSSSFEMISKGKVGMNLYLDKVPLRDSTMTAEDILLSESQERVLLLVQPKNYENLKEIFNKWGLSVCVIGEIKKEQQVELFWGEKSLLKIDPRYLTEKAPRYERSFQKWQPKNKAASKEQTAVCGQKIERQDTAKVFKFLLQNINTAAKNFIYDQYDQRVGAKTIKDCSFPIGVVRLPHSGRSLSLRMGGRPHIMRMDSFEGGKDAVYEPAIQLALRGFRSLAVTDGLNFGSPEKENIMSQFVACVEGMALASRSLGTPVVSGNVSFYNETKGEAVSPTPAMGMIGLGRIVKNSVDISSSVFPDDVPAGTGVYLLSVHQLFYQGALSELFIEKEKKSPVFYGSLNDTLCRNCIEGLLEMSQQYPAVSARVVGKFGLLYSLSRLLMGDLTEEEEAEKNSRSDSGQEAEAVFKGNNSGQEAEAVFNRNVQGMKIDTHYDPFQERLYEVILVLKEKEASLWKKHFIKIDNKIKLEKLGELNKEPFLEFNQEIRLSRTELKTARKKGLAQVF